MRRNIAESSLTSGNESPTHCDTIGLLSQSESAAEIASDSDAGPTTIDDPPPLSVRRIIWIFAALIGLVVLLLLVPIPFDGRVADSMGDLAHPPMFASVALIALSVIHRVRPIRTFNVALVKRFAIVFVIIACFGAGMELVQRYMGRNGSMHDVVANCYGVLAGTLLFAWWVLWRKGVARLQRGVLLIIAVVSLFLGWQVPIANLRDVATMYNGFPLLASFETDAELHRWYFNNCVRRRSELDATDGESALEVTFTNQEHGSATMVELQRDWSLMTDLQFDVALDAAYPENGRLIVKVIDDVHDTDDDMYKEATEIVPGKIKHFRITRDEIVEGPVNRQIDLTKIKYFELILDSPVTTAKLRVDNLRLTLQKSNQ